MDNLGALVGARLDIEVTAADTSTNAISKKHRQFVNQLVNNWEMNLITTGQFTLNTFTVQGQFVPVPPPSSWINAS